MGADRPEEDEIEGGRPSSSRHNSPNSDEGLQERILQVLAGFWTQRLDEDPFASPLWHFVGEQDNIEDLTQRFAQVQDTWLCKATYSPIGYILSLLLFRKKITRETGSRLMVSWSKLILIEDLRTMVAKITANTEDLLWGQLMFKEGNNERFVIPLAGIKDNLTLAGKEVEMLEDLITSSRKTNLLNQTGEFKEFLLLLAHIIRG
ncbi:hypothetical protein DER46DRAFT_619045 [Fusarium sp. MPI-SDFR-AT-0072]|nr:hypothetical protein DER46DRAFT_619045 [Fusarium sp. MPI-SDFR-AT-0072]